MENDSLSKVMGIGYMCLVIDVGAKLVLENVMRVPDICLILIGKLYDEVYCNTFNGGQ